MQHLMGAYHTIARLSHTYSSGSRLLDRTSRSSLPSEDAADSLRVSHTSFSYPAADDGSFPQVWAGINGPTAPRHTFIVFYANVVDGQMWCSVRSPPATSFDDETDASRIAGGPRGLYGTHLTGTTSQRRSSSGPGTSRRQRSSSGPRSTVWECREVIADVQQVEGQRAPCCSKEGVGNLRYTDDRTDRERTCLSSSTEVWTLISKRARRLHG